MHKLVGKLLKELYTNYEIRQEYPVNKINESFPSGREKFDWVVLGLQIVIEVHGQQHFQPVCFGGMLMSEAKKNFQKRVETDERKRTAAEDAGWTYLVVRYDEKNIDGEGLSRRISEAIKKPKRVLEKPRRAKPKATIQSRGFSKDAPKQKIPNRGFPKREGKYQWPKRKISRANPTARYQMGNCP